MEMVLTLREGLFDEIIAGRAQGGMAVLTDPPKIDIDRVGSRKDTKDGKQSTPMKGIAPTPKAVPATAPSSIAGKATSPSPAPSTSRSP